MFSNEDISLEDNTVTTAATPFSSPSPPLIEENVHISTTSYRRLSLNAGAANSFPPPSGPRLREEENEEAPTVSHRKHEEGKEENGKKPSYNSSHPNNNSKEEEEGWSFHSSSTPTPPTSFLSESTNTARTSSSLMAGVCPVKEEYILLKPLQSRVVLDAEGRTRGMNKGADREHSLLVTGTEKPLFEGEMNFFSGETLKKIKTALRMGKQKQQQHQTRTPADTKPPQPQKDNKNEEGAQGTVSSSHHSCTVPSTAAGTAVSPATEGGWEVKEDEEREKGVTPSSPFCGVVDGGSPPPTGCKRQREENEERTSADRTTMIPTADQPHSLLLPSSTPLGADHCAVMPASGPPLCCTPILTNNNINNTNTHHNSIISIDNTKDSLSPAVAGMLAYLPPHSLLEPADFSVRTWEENQEEERNRNEGGREEEEEERRRRFGNSWSSGGGSFSSSSSFSALAPPTPPSGRPLQSEEHRRERGYRTAADDGEEEEPDEKTKKHPFLSLFSSSAPPLVLAPLTTVGNLPFRRICTEFGADVTVSEMAVVHHLYRTQKSEWSLLRRHESESMFGIQLAVANPHEARHVAMALEASGYAYQFLDINGGCPIDLVNSTGCGCALLERRKNSRLPEVVRSLADYQSQPVTLKCRMGADAQFPTLHADIPHYQTLPLAGLTIHGRSRRQRYTKAANWEYVEKCAALAASPSASSSYGVDGGAGVSRALPVIGNGDILGWEDVAAHREACPHISGFMIGRGALIKPWIFEEIHSNHVIDKSGTERLDILKKFCSYGLSHWGSDVRGVMTTRRFLCEWLSFFHRYVPAGLLERLPQKMNERPPLYRGRDEVETMMSSPSVADWISISELLLGPVEPSFRFTPKHKSNSYVNVGVGEAGVGGGAYQGIEGGMEEEDAQG